MSSITQRFWLLVPLIGSLSTLQAAPNIVTSIAPLQSLTAMVTDGLTQPVLIIPANQSPHDFVLRPSAARAIAAADLVVWLGPQGEPNLTRVLATKTARQTMDVSKIKTLTRYPAREAGLYAEQQRHQHGSDPHVWLSPGNAVRIMAALRDRLCEVDPDNAQHYARNAREASKHIQSLHRAINAQLGTVKHRPFIVMHDSLQYFEHEYKLTNLGSLGAHDGYTPGIKRLSQFRNLVQRHHVECVLTEPGGSDRLIQSLGNAGTLRVASIDVLGVGLAPPEEAYFDLMTRLTNSIKNCISPDAH